MNNTQIDIMRKLAECMVLEGEYEVVVYRNGIRHVKAFNLPQDRAQHWASFYPGAIVEKVKGV